MALELSLLLTEALAGHLIPNLLEHLTGHATYDFLKDHQHQAERRVFGARLMHNHDVRRALEESYRLALDMLKDHVKKAPATASERRGVCEVVDMLRTRTDDLFSEAPLERTKDEPIDTLDSIARRLPDAMLSVSSARSTLLDSLIREHFIADFVFVFREIGLKTNGRVRAALVYDLLSDVQNRTTESQTTLLQIQAAVQALIDREEDAPRRALFEQALADRLGTMQESLRRIEVAQAPREDAPAGFVVIRDVDGSGITRYPLFNRANIVGRDRRCHVPLSSTDVSLHHAEITPEAGAYVVKDLGSLNGTRLHSTGETIGRRVIQPGESLRIGPYVIEICAVDPAVGRFSTRAARSE